MAFDELSDEELIGAIPSAVTAFEVLYRRHVAAVLRFFAGRCRTPDDVADATASTFLAVLDSCETFDPESGSALSWLFGIARNEVRDRAREHVRSGELKLRLEARRLLSPDDTERIAEMIDAERRVAQLRPAIDAARPSELELLDRIVGEDEPPAIAARALGITPATGRVRLNRLRQTVRVHARLAGDEARREDRS